MRSASCGDRRLRYTKVFRVMFIKSVSQLGAGILSGFWVTATGEFSAETKGFGG